jgi:hypothetical protein
MGLSPRVSEYHFFGPPRIPDTLLPLSTSIAALAATHIQIRLNQERNMLPRADAVLFLQMIFYELRVVNIFVMLAIQRMLMVSSL